MRRSASGQASAFSAQQHGFESHTSHHLPVAQLDEQPATNRKDMQVRLLSGRPIQQGVAQTGQSSALGMRRSEVRILSP
jgi:hypothetical protein